MRQSTQTDQNDWTAKDHIFNAILTEIVLAARQRHGRTNKFRLYFVIFLVGVSFCPSWFATTDESPVQRDSVSSQSVQSNYNPRIGTNQNVNFIELLKGLESMGLPLKRVTAFFEKIIRLLPTGLCLTPQPTSNLAIHRNPLNRNNPRSQNVQPSSTRATVITCTEQNTMFPEGQILVVNPEADVRQAL
ncbi:hypothetical protein ACOME3_003140 [Neoechinorhynchus agilis]